MACSEGGVECWNNDLLPRVKRCLRISDFRKLVHTQGGEALGIMSEGKMEQFGQGCVSLVGWRQSTIAG